MKSLNVPIIVHHFDSLEDIERKEYKMQNNICKRFFNSIFKEANVESPKDLIIYITRTELYYTRYKKKQSRKKKEK